MGEVALSHISEKDIRILVRHPEPEKRAMAAQRICRVVRTVSLSEKEKSLAHDLLKFMAKDAGEIIVTQIGNIFAWGHEAYGISIDADDNDLPPPMLLPPPCETIFANIAL